MQGLVTMLLICFATMSVLGLIYAAATPLLERRYSANSRYYAWLFIVNGLIIPFRPSCSDMALRDNNLCRLSRNPTRPIHKDGEAMERSCGLQTSVVYSGKYQIGNEIRNSFDLTRQKVRKRK